MITVEETRRRKRRVTEVAYRLFREKGVVRVTCGQVSEGSGVSEASIYRYFKHKSELLLATQTFLWEELVAEIRSLTVQQERYRNATGLEQISALLETIERVYEEHNDALKFALECKLYWAQHNYKVGKKEYGEINGPIIHLFCEAIQQGVLDRSIRQWADQEWSCFIAWGTLRAYLDQVVLVDGFFEGENQYRSHFSMLREMIVLFLANPKADGDQAG